jgi:hypothetical protein
MAEVRKRLSADMVLAQQFTGHVAGRSAFAGKCGQALLPRCDAFAHFAQKLQSFFHKSRSIETSLGKFPHRPIQPHILHDTLYGIDYRFKET